jgi:CheY-like chemotaxis protein
MPEPSSDAAPRPEAERTVAVLVVDDDPVACRMTVSALEAAGWRGEWTTDPLAALERVRHAPYAAIVSDVRMPRMSGPTLAAAVAAIRPTVRTVLISGVVDPRTEAEARALGALLLPKPTPIEALLTAVAATAGHGPGRRSAR